MSIMNESERQQILDSLGKGSTALFEALQDVSAKSAVRIPGPGRWSILQCVEHVAVSEDHLFSMIIESRRTAPVINGQREAWIVANGADRSRRTESPADCQPTGRFATIQEAVSHFQASRVRTIRFVLSNNEDLRSRIASHPIVGTVNCLEVLLLMAVHPQRHARQIVEIASESAGGLLT
jgi:hypothetical protein